MPFEVGEEVVISGVPILEGATGEISKILGGERPFEVHVDKDRFGYPVDSPVRCQESNLSYSSSD